MKKSIYLALALAGVLSMNSCKDDDFLPGNPVMDLSTETADAFFGDSLPFTVKASDVDVPLSTLKAQLFYGEEKVSETVIRTKTSGEDYTGKIYVPFLKEIPDGSATLKYILQNINFTTSEKEVKVALKRADYPTLTLVTEGGEEYTMERTAPYQYSVTAEFPQELKGYFKTPKAGPNSNEVTFGWATTQMEVGSTAYATFSSPGTGAYPITFNTYTYEASPFVKLLVNGEEMEVIDSDNYRINLTLTQGQTLAFEGVPDYDNWWIDPDFFQKEANGELTFLPIGGSYRITANVRNRYFIVQALNSGELATLQSDGTGAIWVIGNGVGKPSLAAKEVGWTTENGLCMSQIEAKKYQITLVAGRTVRADNIDFKFFHQQGWGGEFTSAELSSTSDMVGVGVGGDGLPGNGNLYLLAGQTFTAGHIYKFVVDVTSGIANAVLTVTDEGEQEVEIKNITFGGVRMNSADGEIYTATLNMAQNRAVAVNGIEDLASYYADPDFFTINNNGQVTFLPVDGDYRVTANLASQTLTAVRMNGDAMAGLDENGNGSVLILGYGLGTTSMSNQFDWDFGGAYRMAEVSPKVYRFSGVTGPETPSAVGKRIRYDYISCKFYSGSDWGNELHLTIAPESQDLLRFADGGNLEYVSGSILGDNMNVAIQLDLTAGNDQGVISFIRE